MARGWVRANFTVQTVTNNLAQFRKNTKKLVTQDVLVGIPAEKADRSAQAAKAKGSPINNAALGYIHNYGMPAQNIPARPFLEPGIKNVQDRITRYLQAAGEASLSGKKDGVKKNLIAAGTVASSAIKSKINTGPFKPLAESTLAARRRRGRTGTRPLIDTAQLRNSINFVVRAR